MAKKKVGFGKYVRLLRATRGIGQRELSRLIGISASYLNDIENGKRKAPSKETIKKLAYTLEGNLEHFYDLAGQAQKKIPHDVADILKEHKEALQLLRVIKNVNLTGEKIRKITQSIEEIGMKAIIIAAGKGSRLRSYTEDLPKCMLSIEGKSLLQRQVEALSANGISDISVVKGYKKEKIKYSNLKYYINDNYEQNNILNSLFYAEQEIDGPVIICYSDILYEKEVVSRLLKTNYDISIVVDIDWRGHYEGRKEHPVEEAESVILDADNKVVEIGKIFTQKHDVHGEFIGMMKCTKRGSEIFKRHFDRAKQLFWDKPFQRAPVFEKAYLTDMIQDMIDMGVHIHATIIERGWKEIDTAEDYEKALKEFPDVV